MKGEKGFIRIQFLIVLMLTAALVFVLLFV